VPRKITSVFRTLASSDAFVVVNELFLTETARRADGRDCARIIREEIAQPLALDASGRDFGEHGVDETRQRAHDLAIGMRIAEHDLRADRAAGRTLSCPPPLYKTEIDALVNLLLRCSFARAWILQRS